MAHSSSTRVVFGRGKEKEAGREVRKAGGSKVLLLYGQGSVKKSGLHGTVLAALEKEGIKVVEMSGIVPNPRLSLARKGIAGRDRPKHRSTTARTRDMPQPSSLTYARKPFRSMLQKAMSSDDRVRSWLPVAENLPKRCFRVPAVNIA